jgi:hypothetical protein
MRFFSKLAIVATAAIGFAAAPAQAAVQVTGYTYSPDAIGGGLAVDSAGFSQYGAAGRFLSTIQDLTTLATLQRYTFCIDVLSGYYTYTPYNDVSMSSVISDLTKRQTLAGLLTYANPTIDAAGSPVATSLSAAAFSLAIWEVVHETSGVYNVTLGNFRAFGDLTGAANLANSYLSNVRTGVWSGDVNAVRILASAGNNSQNQIYLAASSAVPEPATWAMMLSGFGLMGAAMRRRAQPKLSFAKA